MRIALAAFALVVTLTIPATAGHCTTWTTFEPEYDIAGRYYIHDDCPCAVEVFFSIWVYEESNGYPGLQRGDEIVDTTCHGMIPADRIVV